MKEFVSKKIINSLTKRSNLIRLTKKYLKQFDANYEGEQKLIYDFILAAFAIFRYQFMRDQQSQLLFSANHLINDQLYQKLISTLGLEDNKSNKKFLTKVLQDFIEELEKKDNIHEEAWAVFKYIPGEGLYLEYNQLPFFHFSPLSSPVKVEIG